MSTLILLFFRVHKFQIIEEGRERQKDPHNLGGKIFLNNQYEFYLTSESVARSD